ncbi:MAG TPA: Fe-S cluster assembly protein SufD [Symbiobacteriaceae bacterium]
MPAATEPAFLAQRRQKAAELVAVLPLPSRKEEDWRRTSLEGLEVEAYKPAPARITLQGNVPEGVIFTDILTAAAQYPDLVSKYLGSLYDMAQNKLSAAQAAYLTGGVFLYVPRNVSVAEPLQVRYEAAEGEAHYLHTLVVAEANASVTLLERFEGTGDYLHVGVVEVIPMDGAKVRYGYLQNQSQDAWTFTARRTRTARDATVEWVGGEFGGGLVRSELFGELVGEGSSSTIKVVYGATGSQHMNIVASEVHEGCNTASDILGRGVLSGRAHTVFWGNGQINHGARNGSTFQRQQALILSKQARADSIPALIINESDVQQAGHASTVGKLDEEQLFYLMSRGLTRQQAVRMLVMAFLSPVLDQIPVEELRNEMIRLMGEKVVN